MTDNPSPPPDEFSPPPPPDFDPRRRFDSGLPHSDEPDGCAGVIGRFLLGIVSFVIAMVVFIMIIAASNQPWVGVVVGGVLVAGMFAIRKHYGPSPILGAAVVGVSIAFVLFGGCMLILANGKIDFK